MALDLEQRMVIDYKKYKDLERFSQHPPFAEAIRLAKENKITGPLIVPNTKYWYLETNLQDWIQEEGTGMLSRFLSVIEGWPIEEVKADDQQTDPEPASKWPNSPTTAS